MPNEMSEPQQPAPGNMIPDVTPSAPNLYKNALIALLTFLLVFGGYLAAANWQSWWPFTQDEAVFCTQDAKLCPDGSYVGRTSPKCEFAACPEGPDTSDWKIYRNEQYGFEFKYPDTIDFWNSSSEKARISVKSYDSTCENCPTGEVPTVVTASKEVTVGDVYMTRDEGYTHQGGPERYWFVRYSFTKGVRHSIMLEPAKTDASKPVSTQLDNTFYQILSTFRFTSTIDTSNWKTYTNTQYGFEIGYPVNYQFESKIIYNTNVRKQLQVKIAVPGELQPALFITVTAGDKEIIDKDYDSNIKTADFELSQWFKESKESPAGKKSNILIETVIANEWLLYSPIGFTTQTILFRKGDIIYHISSYKDSVLDPILSTFRFTK